ncbi:trehalose-phosphatase [Erythrobacter sp. 3-20A1M]|uniref:trehalose-phosphatase n=1 Tax=Erythrobacter sp. 3-20A1M TaxID=2653850 RepID=UPI00203B631D|nr:trehalose-phosphatase [Erythrobacter sp. 3-20A1M]
MAHRTELSPPPALASFETPALFLDFDGTLVDIADEPDAIVVPEDLADFLVDLDERFGGRVAIVTGRSREDIERHLGRVPVCMAGSHGAAIFAADGTAVGDPALMIPDEAKERMKAFATSQGLLFEDKPHGAGLHYRAKPEMIDACVAFAEELAEEHGLAVKRGKQVIELVAPGADKGSAVKRLLEGAPFAGATPIFLGDDVTDEDGFAACAKHGGFGILVGEQKETAARYHIEDVEKVRRWLTA